MNRREFLQLSTLIPTLGLAPSLFAKTPDTINQSPILVLIELKGGNDGLNTLVPIEDEQYRILRPKIAIPAAETIMLDDGFSMHGALSPLQPLWQSGDMAWVHGLGYNNPIHSHFRSIEIWETGNEPDDYDLQGWLTKLYTQHDETLKAVVIGSDAGPLHGSPFDKIIMADLKSFSSLTKRLKNIAAETPNPTLAHVINVQNNVFKNAQTVIDTLKKHSIPSDNFPNHQFGKRLEQTARLIKSGLGATIYKVEVNGFDTHRNQIKHHERLLSKLAGGLDSFSRSMQQSGHWNNVLIMTYSEFGRRAGENKSGGTDHGTAAAHMLLGGRVNGGLHGTPPRLDKLHNSDLIHTTDFRSLYNTIATDWLETKSPWSAQPNLNLIES